MKCAYIYLQLYKLFDNSTPLRVDCGKLCGKACCDGDDSGMLLFPGEEAVYTLLEPDWAKVDETDMIYSYKGKDYNAKILFCKGNCNRFQRPLACRIFPLTPYLDASGNLDVIIDPRAYQVCKLAQLMSIDEFDQNFVKNIKRAFSLLIKNKRIYEYMKMYSEYIDDYKRFFN